MFSGPRPERAALGLLPSILYLAPSDAPDLVAIQVSELTDAVDAGELTVQEIPSDHWRFSRSLDRGGTVILELRRPGDLFRDGVREIQIAGDSGEATLQLAPVPEVLREEAEQFALLVNRLREERGDALRTAELRGDIWEDSAFGEYADQARARTAMAAFRSVDRHPPHPSPRPPFGDHAELRDRLEWWLVRGPSVALFFLAIAILSLFPLLIRALFRP